VVALEVTIGAASCIESTKWFGVIDRPDQTSPKLVIKRQIGGELLLIGFVSYNCLETLLLISYF
jgi:hypothetical protein